MSKEQILTRHGVTGSSDPLADNMTTARKVSDAPLADGQVTDPPAPTLDDPLADVSTPLHPSPASDEVARPSDGAAASPTSTVADCQRNLVASQLRCQRATDQQRECRGRVAVALAAFQRATSATVTQEQLIREHLKSEQARRKERIESGGPQVPTRRLGSTVDAVAFYSRNAGRSAGGGNAFRRGAAPDYKRGQTIKV